MRFVVSHSTCHDLDVTVTSYRLGTENSYYLYFNRENETSKTRKINPTVAFYS